MDSEAAAWAARIDAAPDAQDNELEAWLGSNPRHAGALLRAQAALVALGGSHTSQDVAANDEIEREPGETHSTGRWRWRVAGSLAAAAAALALFVAPSGQSDGIQDPKEYVTQLGETKQVALEDGSSVAIDSITTLEVEYSQDRRLIRLSNGRALFRASDDPARPFQVVVGDLTITDIGTEFQVFDNAATGMIDVVVTEGEILIESPNGQTRLVNGQRIRFDYAAGVPGQPVKQSLSQSDVSREIAWREGRLDLNGETLEEAVAQLNRSNRIQIEVASDTLAGEELYGSFRMNDPLGFAQAAGVSVGAEVNETDGLITISR